MGLLLIPQCEYGQLRWNDTDKEKQKNFETFRTKFMALMMVSVRACETSVYPTSTRLHEDIYKKVVIFILSNTTVLLIESIM
jgi:hypothetical protein